MVMVKMLLKHQADAFNSSFKMLIQDLKEDMKSIRKEITDVQMSLQLYQAKNGSQREEDTTRRKQYHHSQ